MAINHTTAKEFLALFNRNSFIFQTFSDKTKKAGNTITGTDGKVRDSVARVRVGSFENCAKELDIVQRAGAGAFFQVNPGTSRGKKHITAVSALFLDLDGAPIQPVLDDVKAGAIAKPNAIVQSSLGRWHVYWLVDDCTLLDFARLQKALAKKYDGDPKINNLDRVMRLPGSMNYNYNPEGEIVKVKILHKNKVSASDVVDGYQPIQPLPDDMLEEVEEIPAYERTTIAPGDRTDAIMSEAGRVISTTRLGFDDVMDHLKLWELERLPEGAVPKSRDSWETEIAPGVRRYIEQRDRDNAVVATARKLENVAFDKELPGAKEAWDRSILPSTMDYNAFCSRFVWCAVENTVFDLQAQANQKPWRLPDFKTFAKPWRFPGKKRTLVTQWIDDAENRRTVHISTYQPRRWVPNNTPASRIVIDPTTNAVAYNKYQQPLITPPDLVEPERVLMALQQIKYLCSNDNDTFEQLLNWLAMSIQYPERRIPAVPLIISKPGVGKGWLSRLLKKLAGASNVNIIEMDKFDGSQVFTGYLTECTIVVVDEVKGTAKTVDRMKAKISEEELDVNVKYGANQRMPIFANFIMFSNHSDALQLTPDDRRFWVIKHKLSVRPPEDYIKLFNWLESDGPAHLFKYLMQRDLSGYQWSAPAPMNQDKEQMIRDARPVWDQEMLDAIDLAEGVFKSDVMTLDQMIAHIQKRRGGIFDQKEKQLIKRRANEFCTTVGRVIIGGLKINVYAVRNPELYVASTTDELKDLIKKAQQYEIDYHKVRAVK